MMKLTEPAKWMLAACAASTLASGLYIARTHADGALRIALLAATFAVAVNGMACAGIYMLSRISKRDQN